MTVGMYEGYTICMHCRNQNMESFTNVCVKKIKSHAVFCLCGVVTIILTNYVHGYSL